MHTKVIDVDTSDERHFFDLTQRVEGFCYGLGDGLCNVFVPHATAGVVLIEMGAGSDADLSEMIARVLPRDDRWLHRHGSRGHGADHLVPPLLGSSLSVPVIEGRPALGTWQHVVLVDFNEDNPRRQVRFSFVG